MSRLEYYRKGALYYLPFDYAAYCYFADLFMDELKKTTWEESGIKNGLDHDDQAH